ncbi:MAG TPA: toll/interleukin-1 receptor domain-containing protein [Pyrinomonadaceae bacterium]|jgi:hypothetical protein|nr:toll/interleukin-1 receptor domain-containing protein [Pyrinomonadaceae bacterium]
MANLEQLEILKQGVEVWNKWRASNTPVYPNLSRASLRSARLGGVILSDADMFKADLQYSDLMQAFLIQAKIREADFSHTTLDGALFSYATLFYTKLQGATLRGSYLNGADLTGVDLTDADLSGADLTSTNLVSARLKGANFSNAIVSHTTFSGVDLSEARGLESVRHFGPSSVGVDTLYKSRSNIPEKFLRGCGIPENFITRMRDLAAGPFEFHSCFISYSSRDEEFAKRLYNDLQNEGVRCWFAPEDLKTGERFRVGIDEAVRTHDKLLLVLSKNSVSNQWVEKEVETAFEKEAKQKKTVLFPIRLDDAVLKKRTGWAADVKKSRHIADFRDWGDRDAYRKAFEKLVRDLKAGEKR